MANVFIGRSEPKQSTYVMSGLGFDFGARDVLVGVAGGSRALCTALRPCAVHLLSVVCCRVALVWAGPSDGLGPPALAAPSKRLRQPFGRPIWVRGAPLWFETILAQSVTVDASERARPLQHPQ